MVALFLAPDSPHIALMPAPRKSASGPAGPKSKASRPEVHPLGEHLAELLNPALVEPKTQGFGERPQPRFETPAPESHPRGLTGAAVTADLLKALLEEGDPNIRNRPPWLPHRPPRPDKSEGGRAFRVVSEFEPKGDQPRAIEELLKGVHANERDQVLLGVTGSGKTFTMAKVIEATQRPALVLAPNKTLAAQLYGEFKSFFPDNAVEYFVSYYDYYQPEAYVPRTDTYIEKESDINEQIDRMRHSATRALLERDDVIIVASVSCIYGIGSVETYTAMTFSLKLGDKVDQRQLVKDLVALQYKRVQAGDFSRGLFRVRGDTIEVFPAHYEDRAWRIGLFGDEIELIVEFDPLTGVKTQDLEFVKVYANSHYVTPRPTLLQSIEGMKLELKVRLDQLHAQGRLLEAQRLEQRTLFDLEMLEATGSCAGIENYSRYLTGRRPGEPPPTLFEYLPDNALVFTDESHVTIPQIGGMYRGDYRRKATLAEYGFRLPSCMDNRPLRFEEWEAMRPQTVHVSATPGHWEMEQTEGAFVEQVIRPTGLIDPPVEIRPARSPGRRPPERDQGGRAARLSHAGHGVDQAHGRGPDRISARERRARPLHALGHRHHRAHRDHPRSAPRRLRRAGRHQPPARGPRHSRMRARRHSRRRQGRFSAFRDIARADDRPRGAQRRRQGRALRRRDHRLDHTGDGGDRRGGAKSRPPITKPTASPRHRSGAASRTFWARSTRPIT